MKVKLDENLPSSATDIVTAAGFDVDTVPGEGLAGAADDDVVAAATAADRLLITLDRGLGDVRRHPPGSHPGIVVLRLPDQSAPAIRSTLEELLAAHDLEALRRTVTVVERGLLRVGR